MFPFKLFGGSSPLARGTRGDYEAQASRGGLIPARAGNTAKLMRLTFTDWAHPRSRGEHYCESHIGDDLGGSSPLARGTRTCAHGSTRSIGLIPARAGNTARRSFLLHPAWAHPRSRGEHRMQLTISTLLTGSSPLARGTPNPRLSRRAGRGLIPARAGNTLCV